MQKNNAPTQKSFVSSFVRTTLTLLVIAAFIAAMLAAVNFFTSEKINENKLSDTQKAISGIFPGAKDFTPLENISFSLPVTDIWTAGGEDGMLGYCVFVTAHGFNAGIDIVVGVLPSGECAGVRVVTQSETPGLGSRIIEDGYLSQYIGKTGSVRFPGDIDSVAGATVSSRALHNGIRAALSAVSAETKTNGDTDSAPESETDFDAGVEADTGKAPEISDAYEGES